MGTHPRTLLAISGSLRRGSHNRALLDAAAECAPPGVTVRIYDGLSRIPLFDEDLEREVPDGPEEVRRLRAEVGAADGVVIATPEYNQSFPGVLKNAIDWLSRPAPTEVLAGRPVAVIGATRGRWGTRLAQAALRQVLCATESQVLPHPSLFIAESDRLFDGAGRLVDPATRERLSALLAAFDRWIEATGHATRSSATPGPWRTQATGTP